MVDPVKPSSESYSVVLAGTLNPAIFTPQWLFHFKLIDEEDAQRSKLEIIHPDVSVFSLPWCRIAVQREQFTIATNQTPGVNIFDLTLRIFTELLSHTPLRAAGINFEAHFAVPDWAKLHQLGDAVAPKTPWGEWGKQLLHSPKRLPNSLAREQLDRSGGLGTITMKQTVRPDNLEGSINARLEPSVQIRPGVFMNVNDHYEPRQDLNVVSSVAVTECIAGKFDESIRRSRWIMNEVLKDLLNE